MPQGADSRRDTHTVQLQKPRGDFGDKLEVCLVPGNALPPKRHET